ncbi:MAG: two component transcriptional regulator, LuxR family [Polaromonas sp.]|nr:two component transcriptional regulator, LuxR family [Polaromonas sp.]
MESMQVPQHNHKSEAQVEQVSTFKTKKFPGVPGADDYGRGMRDTAAIGMWPDFLAGQPGKPVRVLLIDDDANVRKVIAQELLDDLRIDLVAEGGSLREGRRLISQYQFDVMLVDLNLGDGSGFELIKCMKAIRPGAEAVVISATDDDMYVLRAFELGANGYLVKNFWFGDITQSVLQVVNGGASITPNLARRLLRKLEHGRQPGDSPDRDQQGRLSDREKEILTMVASGFTSAQIGPHLRISCQTVNTHIKNIYRKLQVRSRAQAVAFAARQGLF